MCMFVYTYVDLPEPPGSWYVYIHNSRFSIFVCMYVCMYVCVKIYVHTYVSLSTVVLNSRDQ